MNPAPMTYQQALDLIRLWVDGKRNYDSVTHFAVLLVKAEWGIENINEVLCGIKA